MYHFVIEREDEVERLEAERRRRVQAQQERMRASHAAAAAAAAVGADGEAEAGDASEQNPGAAPSRRARRRMAAMGQQAAPPSVMQKPQTVKRDKPKLGRNDACWCGSGKKYKSCHLRSDEEAQAAEG
jgi:preprotein translocase subunit SecA